MKKILSVILLCVLTMNSVYALSKPKVTSWKLNSTKHVIEVYKVKGAKTYKFYTNGKEIKPIASYKKGKIIQFKFQRKDKSYKVRCMAIGKNSHAYSKTVTIPKIRKVKGSVKKYILKQIQKGETKINIDGFNLAYGNKYDIRTYVSLNNLLNFVPFMYLNGNVEYWQFCNYSRIESSWSPKNVFGGKTTGELQAIPDLYTTLVTKAELKEKNKFAKKKFNIKFKGSDFEKVQQIHNRLIGMLSYGHGKYDQCFYSAAQGKTVCAGFASAFQYLCKKNGVKSEIVYNNNHAWNQVKIGKKWYVVDVTWDNTVAEKAKNQYQKYRYFLVSNKKHGNLKAINSKRELNSTYKMRRK